MKKLESWVKFDQVDDQYGKFELAPLENGMGLTIGNSIRRVLLSSLEGVAPVNIKIDGVTHEFSTIKGVKEIVNYVIINE